MEVLIIGAVREGWESCPTCGGKGLMPYPLTQWREYCHECWGECGWHPHENPCAPRQVASGIGTDWHVGVLSGWRSATALLQAHGLVQPHLGEV